MKVYEVTISGRTRWIQAKSKKAIKDFFDSVKLSAIIYRPDVSPDNTFLIP